MTDSLPADDRVQIAFAERVARFGYWHLRIADNRATWSPGLYRLLGIDETRNASQALLIAQFSAADAMVLCDGIARAIRTNSGFRFRGRANAKTLDIHCEVEFDGSGQPLSVTGVCQDVTPQMIAEAEREQAQRIYRAMAEESSDIVMFHGADSIYFASKALERILGRKPEEIHDGRYLNLVHPDDVQEALKLRGTPGPGEIWTATYRGLHSEGHYVWLEARTRAAYDEKTGQLLQEISVTRDVTERKEHELSMKAAQERAEAASRAKTLFLANMSHELRTPLNAIIGFADLMGMEAFGALGHERYKDYVNDIRNSGQLLLEVISGVLDIAKIEAGRFDLSFEPIDLGDVARDCIQMMTVQAQSARVALRSEIGSAVPLVADRRAVKQILLNLLSNAVKFTPAGGQAIVKVRADGDRVVLSVTDTGIGIPEEQIGRLGRPFEQVCVDPHLAKGGAGLGLALVSSLAREHGGSLDIASAVGNGTTVTVTLPASRSRRAAA